MITTLDRPHRTLTVSALAEVVCRVAADRSLWAPLVDHDAAGPRWSRLPVPEGVDVWVASWPTFERTELHSHADATAAYTAVEGVITDVRLDDAGRLLPRKITSGVVEFVAPDEVHDIRNEHVERAVTIHAYSPRLSEVRYFSWHNRALSLERVARTSQPAAATQAGQLPQKLTSASSTAKPWATEGSKQGAAPTAQGTSSTAPHDLQMTWWWLSPRPSS